MEKPKMEGWTPEQIKAYEEAAAALAAEETAAEQARVARERAEASPEAMVERLRAQAEAAREARARAERDAADDAAYAKACKAHGGEKRVARVRTVDGAIIMRAIPGPVWEDFQERVAGLESEADIRKIAQQVTLDYVEYPKRERVLEILKDRPRLWPFLYVARDALVTGLEEESRGKG